MVMRQQMPSGVSKKVKTPLLELLFHRVTGGGPNILGKMLLWQMCFPVKLKVFLKHFFKEYLRTSATGNRQKNKKYYHI